MNLECFFLENQGEFTKIGAVRELAGFFQDHGKGGFEFKGGSLHDGFVGLDGFGGSGVHLTVLLLVLQKKTAQ